MWFRASLLSYHFAGGKGRGNQVRFRLINFFVWNMIKMYFYIIVWGMLNGFRRKILQATAEIEKRIQNDRMCHC